MFVQLLLASSATLHVALYDDYDVGGPHPASTSSADALEFAVDVAGSAEVTGTVTLGASPYYAFNCTYGGGQLVFVWLADHLICHTDPPFPMIGQGFSSHDGSPSYPLRGGGRALPLVIHVYAASADGSGRVTSAARARVAVRWTPLAAPLPAGATPTMAAIPAAALSPASPPHELTRRALQHSLKAGWNTWSHDMLTAIKLPQSFGVALALCQLSTQACLSDIAIEDKRSTVRVGPFAVDQSYWQFYVGFEGVNVSFSYTGGAGPLHVLAEPVGCGGGGVDCGDYALVVMPRYLWWRVGALAVDGAAGTLSLTSLGATAATAVRASAAPVALPPKFKLPAPFNTSAHFALPLGNGAVGLREGAAAPTVAELTSAVAAARKAEEGRYAKYGDLAPVKEAVQAATLWNYIYSPAEYGPMLPVSRSWDFVRGAHTTDWSYVIFDWDNIFASYMTSLDAAAKPIAYSNFIQVIRSRTARGFVPNYSAGGSKSVDRTEPPIGATVLLELHTRFNDTWLAEFLFDDLLAWSDWFVAEREFGPLGLVSLGSDNVSGYTEFSAGQMQGARYESGLDNSPMYDGDFFKVVKAEGSLTIGQMAMYDVGFASMVVREADALATLATRLGRADDATRLAARAAAQRKLIADNLWDDRGGIFTNRFWNGSFYRRVSPTSFYAMLARAATDEQAAAMVSNWLLSPDHFCIAPEGDMAGNSDSCWWGLPSIEASDPAYPPLGYWRGYVWGPMAQLTYWSLQQYDHVPIVRKGRKALCKQMAALMLDEWRRNRHICENFNPHRNATECSGTKFYHWGALNGMITMVEEGWYSEEAPPPARSPSDDPPVLTCQPVNRSAVSDFCGNVSLPPRVCVDAAGFHYGRDGKGYAKQEKQCATHHKAKKTCPNDPSECAHETLTKDEWCGRFDQACTTDADCLPDCFADCWPCNDAGDCDLLEAFGILAPKGDPRCFSVKNHSA